MAKVITIGRKFGSAGRDIGKKVAELLGIPFYDKELVEMAAEKGNLNPGAVKKIDERATNSLLYSVVSGSYIHGAGYSMYNMPINDKLFIAQTEVIKEIAKQDCVIVGRCADYILEDEADVNLLSVFVYASDEFCMDRIMNELELTKSKAKDAFSKTNKRRRNYYEYYTGKDWGKMQSYNLCIDVSKMGIDNAAQMIADAAGRI